MKKQNHFPMSISGACILMVCVVLCMVIFGVLSLTSAQSEWQRTQQNADYTQQYYTQKAKGHRTLQGLSQQIDTQGVSQAETILKSDPHITIQDLSGVQITGQYTSEINGAILRIDFVVTSGGLRIQRTTYSHTLPQQGSSNNVWRPGQ